jgi:hypothetical protein
MLNGRGQQENGPISIKYVDGNWVVIPAEDLFGPIGKEPVKKSLQTKPTSSAFSRAAGAGSHSSFAAQPPPLWSKVVAPNREGLLIYSLKNLKKTIHYY